MAKELDQETKNELIDILFTDKYNLNDANIKLRLVNILFDKNNENIYNDSQINNQINLLQENINSSKHIVIKILSMNEFNKYIVNGTCDGSINKGDKNVWRTSDNPCGNDTSIILSDLNQGFGGGKGPEAVLTNNNGWIHTPYTYYSCYNSQLYGDNPKYAHYFFKKYACYSECTQQNKTNTTTVYHKNFRTQIVRFHHNTYYQYGGGGYINNIYNIGGNSEINKTNIQYIDEQTMMAWSAWNSSAWTGMRFTFYTSFRPAFAIKDNNKSNSLYY